MTDKELTALTHEEFIEYGRKRLTKFMIIITIMFSFLGLTVGGAVYYVATTSANNKKALCAYRTDLESRLKTNKQVLKDNPEGILGVKPSVLASNIKNQKAVIKAFSIVTCNDQAS